MSGIEYSTWLEAPAISILPHTLWPLLSLAMVALWTAAMADISRHRRRGAFTEAGLVGMAVAVSAVTVIALAGIGVVFGQRLEGVSRADYGDRPGELGVDVPGHSYVFSFGLEHAPDVTPAGPADTKREQPG